MIRRFTSFLAIALTGLCVLTQPASAGGRASRFELTIDGVDMAMFSELRLFVAADTGEPAIALVRGEGGAELSSWNRSGRRRSATITVYDIAGQEVARFIMELAWPSKVEISGLKAGASEVLYESVIFQYGSMVTTAQPTGTLTGP